MKNASLFKRLYEAIKSNVYFIIVIICTFLALALIVTMTFGSFYKSDRENAVSIGKMTVALQAQQMEDTLDSGINTLLVSGYTVDSMIKNGFNAKKIEEYIIQETQGIITGINPDFSGIYGVVYDTYIDGIQWQPEEGYNPYTRPWYIAAAEKKGELAIVSPYIDAQTNSIMVSFSKILCDGKSAVSLDISLDNINDVVENVQLNGKGYCFLTDKKGQVIAHRDQSQVGKNYLNDSEFSGSDIRTLIERINASTEIETLQNVNLNGDRCMAFSHCIYDEWNIVLVVSENDLFENIRTSLIRNIIISLAIFILVGYFCTSNYRNKKRALKYAEDVRTDDLTGLNNRGEFDRYLRTTLNNISTDKMLYLLLFDADGFKSINDGYGHQEGDRALRFISGVLTEACKNTDWFCARYGGDEFVIICRCSDEITVKKIISDIENKLNKIATEKKILYKLSLR